MTTHSVLAGAVLLGFSSTAAFAGVTLTQITTVDGTKTAVTKISADGANSKMEMVESPDNPFMPPGSYMLVRDGELLLVNPAARTYARFDTAMFEGISAMAGQMEITDVKFEKVVDEPGETIAGYPTRHYQFKSSWTMAMQGMPVKTESSTVEDLWTTTAIEMPALPDDPAGGMPSQVTALVENQGLRQVEGVPLKHVTVQSTKTNMGALGGIGGLGARLGGRMLGGAAGAGGGGGETTTTIEAVDIEEGDVPAGTFELPDGYQETQLFQTGPAIPNLNGVQEPPDVPNLNDLERVATRSWSARSSSPPLAARCCRSRRVPRRWTSFSRAARSRASSTPWPRSSSQRKAPWALTEQQRATAITQVKRALGRQTNPMALTMQRRGRHDELAVDAADARERAAVDVGRRPAALRRRHRQRGALDRRRAGAAGDAASHGGAVGARHRRRPRVGSARRCGGGRTFLRRVPADAAG